MEMIEVKSSNIRKIGHDTARKVLAIEFTSGQTYEYQDVSSEVFEKMRAAESVGKFFFGQIKNGGYKYAKMENAK
jgi:hypothetical protein